MVHCWRESLYPTLEYVMDETAYIVKVKFMLFCVLIFSWNKYRCFTRIQSLITTTRPKRLVVAAVTWLATETRSNSSLMGRKLLKNGNDPLRGGLEHCAHALVMGSDDNDQILTGNH